LKILSTFSNDVIIEYKYVKEFASNSHIVLDRLKSRTSLSLTALEKLSLYLVSLNLAVAVFLHSGHRYFCFLIESTSFLPAEERSILLTTLVPLCNINALQLGQYIG